MIKEAPRFWWQKPGIPHFLLRPLASLYSRFAVKNLERDSVATLSVPILCIGNYTLGGCGKTPLALAFAKSAKACGLTPGFVTRGYGGTVKDVHLVISTKDTARLVGDEPLLLAKTSPTIVGADRYKAAKMLQEQGCDFIIMDDGFQSRRLQADYSLMLIDGMRGFGNGAVFPAGPLRAPLKTQFAYTTSVAIIGQGEAYEPAVRLAARAGKRIDHINFIPFVAKNIQGKPLLAFCGIGNPDKFFYSAEKLGGCIKDKRIYSDHHFFTDYDIKDLQDTAENRGLILATTAKDYVRLESDFVLKKQIGEEDFKKFLKKIVVFDIGFQQDSYCKALIKETQRQYYKRRFTSKQSYS